MAACPEDRENGSRRPFRRTRRIAPCVFLLATDAASEGVNLQNHCSQLIHFEIPWNPNRMEQRNGRVDRMGRRADEVHIYHFVGRGFDDNQASVKLRRSRSRPGISHARSA